MRLPITPQISTKDGVSNKNARLYNALKETRPSGESIAQIRPGLVASATSTGNAGGLVCFNGNLISIYGVKLGFGVAQGGTAANLMYLPFNGELIDSVGGLTITPVNQSFQNFSSSYVVCGDFSYFYSANGAYIAIQPSQTLLLGTSNWTVETWIYIPNTNTTGTAVVLDINDQVENIFTCSINGMCLYFQWEGTEYVIGSTSPAMSYDIWNHVAWVRDGSYVKTYLNGNQVVQLGVTLESIQAFDVNDFVVNSGGGPSYYSELGFSNYAKYTGSFNPACNVAGNTIPALATIQQGIYDFAQSPL